MIRNKIKNPRYCGFLALILFTLSSFAASSSITRYVLEQERAPAKPLIATPMPSFAEYKPHLYSKGSGDSPFGLHNQASQTIVPLLESVPLNQIKMVGMIYFEKESWGLISFPNGMIERVKPGMILGAEHGKIVAITVDKIVIENQSASSLKINITGTGSVRRTELRLV
jgi:Tfp pilus assembly protein PilP